MPISPHQKCQPLLSSNLFSAKPLQTTVTCVRWQQGRLRTWYALTVENCCKTHVTHVPHYASRAGDVRLFVACKSIAAFVLFQAKQITAFINLQRASFQH